MTVIYDVNKNLKFQAKVVVDNNAIMSGSGIL